MISLDDTIRNYMIQKDWDVETDYQRFYQIAVNGLKDLWFDITGTPKYCIITLDGNGQADLPVDFLKLIRVGIINRYGELVALGENQRLAYVDNVNDCGVPQRFPVQNAAYQNYQVGGYNSYHTNTGVNPHGELTGGFFGTKGRVAIGEYKIDVDKNKIVTSNLTSTGNLVLEYLSNLSRSGDDYKIHDFLEEPLWNYMEWASLRMKRNVPAGEKDRLKREYYTAKNNLRLRKFSRNADTIMQYARKNNSQIKF